MTDSLAGALGYPVLDGHVLDQAVVQEQDVFERKIASLATLANGDRREALVHSGAGYPLKKVKRRIVLRYANIRDHLDLVEELLAGPGPHDLVIWKRIHLAFAGGRTEFFLFHRAASHASYYPPPELPTPPLAVEVRVGINGTPLTVVKKSSADYDAGDPAADEAWFVDGGQKFKVGAAPPSGSYLYVRMVPIFSMYEEIETERRYRSSTIREPRDIALVEA